MTEASNDKNMKSEEKIKKSFFSSNLFYAYRKTMKNPKMSLSSQLKNLK
jgi:hypothetical protein